VKTERFKSILEFLLRRNIGSIKDLGCWSDGGAAREEFLEIRGVGNKTFDYLRMLCGRATFPLDRYFLRFLSLAGVNVKTCGYNYAQQLLMDSCIAVGLEPRTTERRLWSLLRRCV
jgi:endonuclease III-like uncharacterized protein